MKSKWIFSFLAVVLLFVVARCGQKDPEPGTFGAVYKSLKTSNCNTCHVPTGAATKDSETTIDFTSQETAYATLSPGTATVKGKTSKTICANVKLVATTAASSYLAAVLFSDYNKSNFGGKTGCSPITDHFSYQNLSSSEKDSIVNWITNGAKND